MTRSRPAHNASVTRPSWPATAGWWDPCQAGTERRPSTAASRRGASSRAPTPTPRDASSSTCSRMATRAGWRCHRRASFPCAAATRRIPSATTPHGRVWKVAWIARPRSTASTPKRRSPRSATACKPSGVGASCMGSPRSPVHCGNRSRSAAPSPTPSTARSRPRRQPRERLRAAKRRARGAQRTRLRRRGRRPFRAVYAVMDASRPAPPRL